MVQAVQLDRLNVGDIQLSLGRCLTSTNSDSSFMETFYRIFVRSHPDIKILFSETDLEKQYELLKIGLNMVILFANKNDSIAKNLLEKIRKTHCKEKLNIRPELYKYWINSLIEAIRIKDSQFNDVLELKWRAVLQNGVSFIVAGY